MAVSPYRITLRYQTVEAAAWDVNADGRVTADEGADLRHDLWTARLAPPAQAGMRLRVEGLDAAGVPRAWILPLSVGQTAVGVATRAYLPVLDKAGQTRRAHYTATLTDASGAVLATAEGVEEDVWAGAVEPIEGQIGIIKDDVEIVKGEIGDAETPGTIKHTLSAQDTRLGTVEADLTDAEGDIATLFGDVADLEGDVIGLEAGLEARPIGVLYSADREFYAVYATPDGPEEVLIVKLGALAEKDTVGEEDLAEEVTDAIEDVQARTRGVNQEPGTEYPGTYRIRALNGVEVFGQAGNVYLVGQNILTRARSAFRSDVEGALQAYDLTSLRHSVDPEVGGKQDARLTLTNVQRDEDPQPTGRGDLWLDFDVRDAAGVQQGFRLGVHRDGTLTLSRTIDQDQLVRIDPVAGVISCGPSLSTEGTVTANGGFRTRDLANALRTGITATLNLADGGTATVVNGIVVAHTPGDGKN